MSKPSNRLAVAALACCCLLATAARAELADRDKPVNLEADTMTVDDLKKVSVYQGNVILTQGTLTIHADKLVVTENKDGSHHGSATGNPATFRQKREGVEEYVEGYGQRIEYEESKDVVELFTQARMKRNQDEVRGNYISYDGKTEFFRVIGGKEAVTANNPKGRVRAVIQPKKKAEATPAPGADVELKPAVGIANP
ncbi:MAG: lipopolysaccharide transport periplasmic protein LptA [Sulfuricella sp.]|nr:lipopolysaccharide transport periplasmic protein LptA [Sulfuricella sp.]